MATVDCTARREREDRTIARALRILEKRARYHTEHLDSARQAGAFLRLRLGGLEHEEFWCVWLNSQHCVIKAESMFRGTLTQTSVYAREIVKSALRHNAATVIFAHNHPSGNPEPSAADELLTRALKQALALVDVKVLDHFIIGAETAPLSMAERGLI